MSLRRARITALLAATALLAWPSSAQAGGDDLGDFGVVGVVDFIATDGCVSVPVLYAFTGIPSGGSWDLTLTDGAALSSFLYGTDASSAGEESMTWCINADGVGRFQMTGTLEVRDGNYETFADVPVSFEFMVSKQATAVGLRVSTTRPRPGTQVRLAGCVNSGGSRDRYRPVVVQHRKVGGSWRYLQDSYTDSAGCYLASVTAASTSRFYRVSAAPTDAEKLGRSVAIKVTPRR